VIVIDTEVVNKSFIQMQLGYCRDIASYSGGKYYPIADLTSEAVHDIVIQERERSLLSDLQAVLG
jgi:magnesium chelatase subunit D